VQKGGNTINIDDWYQANTLVDILSMHKIDQQQKGEMDRDVAEVHNPKSINRLPMASGITTPNPSRSGEANAQQKKNC
jgi:hypothetical protein